MNLQIQLPRKVTKREVNRGEGVLKTLLGSVITFSCLRRQKTLQHLVVTFATFLQTTAVPIQNDKSDQCEWKSMSIWKFNLETPESEVRDDSPRILRTPGRGFEVWGSFLALRWTESFVGTLLLLFRLAFKSRPRMCYPGNLSWSGVQLLKGEGMKEASGHIRPVLICHSDSVCRRWGGGKHSLPWWTVNWKVSVKAFAEG